MLLLTNEDTGGLSDTVKIILIVVGSVVGLLILGVPLFIFLKPFAKKVHPFSANKLNKNDKNFNSVTSV